MERRWSKVGAAESSLTAKVSGKSQPPITFDLPLSELAGSPAVTGLTNESATGNDDYAYHHNGSIFA
jgi:hypothetical protein